jgi:hypothetical protein
VCHFLYIASPLTLSEVRSMLPDGLTADLLAPTEARLLVPLHTSARTFARLVAGACSCDLFIQRDPEGRREEAELRKRFRSLGLSRDRTIAALERHRRGAKEPRSPEVWRRTFAAFVAEHARNAGPTLYFRHVSPDGLGALPPPRGTVRVTVPEVLAAPGEWLKENQATMVVRPPA